MMKEKDNWGVSASFSYRNDLIISLVFSLAILVLCLFFEGCLQHHKIMFFLVLPIMYAGRSVFAGAVTCLRRKKTNVDVVLASGAIAAFFLSTIYTFGSEQDCNCFNVYYESIAAIITLALYGKFILQTISSEADHWIRRVDQSGQAARLLYEGKELIVPMENIKMGDRLIIKAGETIPFDGIIVEGIAEIDESFIGRLSSIRKYPEEEVIGGSKSKSSDFVLEVCNAGSDTIISKVRKLLNDDKAPGLTQSDRFAFYYLSGMILASLVTLLTWILFSKIGAVQAITFAVEVMIFACPCALAIAVPWAYKKGYDKIIKHGIMLRNLNCLDTIEKFNMLVVDKSGVLTTGKGEVAEILWKGERLGEDKFKSVLFSITHRSARVIDAAVAEYFSRENVPLLEVEEMEQFDTGIRAKIQGDLFYFGTDAFIGMINHGRYLKKERYFIHEISGMEYFFDDIELKNQIQRLKDAGLQVYLAADSKAVFAIVGIGEGIRKSAIETIQSLIAQGVKPVLITSGGREAAQSVADKLGIEKVYADALPFAKADIIRELQKEGNVIALASQNPEDGPALAQANVGFALVSGIHAPVGNAKVALLDGDISRIAEARRLASSLNIIIRSNIFWAVVFNVGGIIVASGILYSITGLTLTSALSGVISVVSTIAVFINSLKINSL